MATFVWEFSELPLVILPGIEAGMINGAAEIEYRGDDWSIKSVSLEGYQKLTQAERNAGKKPWVYVDAPHQILELVLDRLYGEWRDRVQSAVSDQADRDREEAAETRAETRAEMRRERAMGEW